MAEEIVQSDAVEAEDPSESAAVSGDAGPSTPLRSAQDDGSGDSSKENDAVSEPTLQEPFALESRPIAAPLPESKRGDAKKNSAAKEEASQSPFSVTVGQVYDGPFDLLLDLIRKQNIDIYDIPISQITSQFLEYTHHLKQVDVDSAGEFIYMASLLIHIKSKTMLPRDPSDVTGADSEDPRRELVERLLEHERFKAAAQMLMQKQQIEEATWSVPGIREFREDTSAEREIAADVPDLVRVFQDILARMRSRPVLNVDEESVTVAQMIEYVKRRLLMEEKPVSLRKLLHQTHSERALICMFLAMLELVRLQAVLLNQPALMGDILIKKTENFDAVFADQAQTRDDWR
ncbi:segregation and condensation protein A [Granulicella aggregans]|uniref:Segregation and condensation protein A n=1 Tax=Granulicella aggregans TaxID=474949 RepID=A0A7W7ZBZ0_9BACT|nr:segregation/condensation protein A [Granulicella aggregans]MBB5056561.1 segregation and condensation protein A [Granulicella aggregans]